MGKPKGFTMSVSERRNRKFSTSFKIKKVHEIELGRTKVSELCRQYEISFTTVYRWLEKYGTMKDKKERVIVETDSDTQELLACKKRIAELEQTIGQKQVKIEFMEKLIELAKETYNIDLKKNYSTQR